MPLRSSDEPSGVFTRYQPKVGRKKLLQSVRDSDKKFRKKLKITVRQDQPESVTAASSRKSIVEPEMKVDVKDNEPEEIITIDDDEDEGEYEVEEEYEEIVVAVDEDGNEIEDPDLEPSDFEVLIQNLDPSITNKDICLDLFQDKDVRSVVLHENDQGESQGVAEVHFGSKEDAQSAVMEFNGASYMGRILKMVLLIKEVKTKPVNQVLKRKKAAKKTVVKKTRKVSQGNKKRKALPRKRKIEINTIPDDDHEDQQVEFKWTESPGKKKKKPLVISRPGALKKTISIRGKKKSLSIRKRGEATGIQNIRSISIKKRPTVTSKQPNFKITLTNL
mmetsp:Transcript_8985/g.13444  ORF Transcript_8985/g.13444 Transcript_8985/m.13444 type:complete len:333 (+) Transcript_8985:64-1062(+)